MTHADLVKTGLRWLSNRCTVVFAEFATSSWETPDVIGWSMGTSTLIECKASWSDFLSDKKKPFRQNPEFAMGRYRFYLCPWDMICVNELPEKWGLLWARNGRVYIRKHAEPYSKINQHDEMKFLVSMLRRAQVRLGKQPLSEWLHMSNMDNLDDPGEGEKRDDSCQNRTLALW
jgi:hypothetical protein